MEIPYQKIPQELLIRLIESFVMREGTDYGHSDYSLPDKVEKVMMQLRQKKVIVTFDQETETFNIVPKHTQRSK